MLGLMSRGKMKNLQFYYPAKQLNRLKTSFPPVSTLAATYIQNESFI